MRLYFLAAALLPVACASNEYVCPKPIGRIIRDDCEVYRTRFEALKAELSANVGPLGTALKLGKEKLRDPSQLTQILSHRTYALCRDFNACRVSPQEYRQRREQADRIFTAVGAINAQLKQDLPATEKATLVAKLVALLSEDRATPAPTAHTTPSRSTAKARPSGAYYHSWLPWYGTKRLPPQPNALSETQLSHASFSLQHVFRSNRGAVGFSIRGRFLLRGALAADDLLTMHYGSKQADCRIARGSRGTNGMVSVSCSSAREEALSAPVLAITLERQPGGEGKAQPVGRTTLRTLSRVQNPRNGSRTFAEDHDPLARHLRLIFRPAERSLPPRFERPSLLAVLKLRDYRRKAITARCWVDGKTAGPAIPAYGRNSGSVGQFQDQDRYRQISPGHSVAVPHPFVSWRRYDFPLPFYLPHLGGDSPPEGCAPWPQAGRWRCVVAIEGDPVREARFVVRGDGTLEPIPLQKKRPSAEWLLDTRVVPSKYEEPLR